ncbi:CIC11C00000002895 [Sungouiella intermedia]|uniref:CIC11C00000002895 n=1 Tax=Sungouiella intermedia TaxID=45354 RepID=A0A1L0FTU0_9ASCO|nr:CIC11C00000002895 [[Candida] intermedia]
MNRGFVEVTLRSDEIDKIEYWELGEFQRWLRLKRWMSSGQLSIVYNYRLRACEIRVVMIINMNEWLKWIY